MLRCVSVTDSEGRQLSAWLGAFHGRAGSAPSPCSTPASLATRVNAVRAGPGCRSSRSIGSTATSEVSDMGRTAGYRTQRYTACTTRKHSGGVTSTSDHVRPRSSMTTRRPQRQHHRTAYPSSRSAGTSPSVAPFATIAEPGAHIRCTGHRSNRSLPTNDRWRRASPAQDRDQPQDRSGDDSQRNLGTPE